jgi:LruC domain-containing protein
MTCRFAIRAIGAHYSHGFGFQMNLQPSEVTSVTGTRLFDNMITVNGNNAEAGQDKVTIIAFDNDYKVMNRAVGNSLNTDPDKPYQVPDTVTLNVTFDAPKTLGSMGAAPFNPFIFVGNDRGKEIHLAGFNPTLKANRQYFGTLNDNTNPGKNIYYKTKTNLPFGLHIADDFVYSQERKPIIQGHLRFVDWVQSGGSFFADWFRDAPGYRDYNKLYR